MALGNMDKLNQWLTLSANVAVLLGIVFVAYELRQNIDAPAVPITHLFKP